jgi:hypothetical protein
MDATKIKLKTELLKCTMKKFEVSLPQNIYGYVSLKMNGAIRRHFGKQMNKETKLRIHNITAKAAMKFGSEAWLLKEREEQCLEAALMKF